MRKDKATKSAVKDDKFKSLIHNMWDSADDAMDEFELKSFITDSNLPRIKELNEDDKIGVEEVLVIGGYLALNKLHVQMHEDMDEKLNSVLRGEVELKEVAPENMPEDLLDALSGLVDIVKDIRKKKER